MISGEQTSFELEDAQILLNQLQQFQETLRQEWSRVLSQWSNMKHTWRDEQYYKFEPLFEKLSSTYNDAEKECDTYIIFINEQIQVAEKRKQSLGNLDTLF